jgi:hypothetical protein
MNKQSLIFLGLTCVALIVTSGCGKKDESTAVTAPGSAPAAGGTIEKAVANAQAQTEVVKQQAQNLVTNVQAQASAVTAQAQGMIDQAKALMGENKWSEALAMLNKLSGQSLSADQQSLVQSLQNQAQKGLEAAAAKKATDAAANAVGGLLKK